MSESARTGEGSNVEGRREKREKKEGEKKGDGKLRLHSNF